MCVCVRAIWRRRVLSRRSAFSPGRQHRSVRFTSRFERGVSTRGNWSTRPTRICVACAIPLLLRALVIKHGAACVRAKSRESESENGRVSVESPSNKNIYFYRPSVCSPVSKNDGRPRTFLSARQSLRSKKINIIYCWRFNTKKTDDVFLTLHFRNVCNDVRWLFLWSRDTQSAHTHWREIDLKFLRKYNRLIFNHSQYHDKV